MYKRQAMLSKNMKGTRPVFPKEKYIDIKDGRHPLIDPKKVVPINLHLGRDFSLLVVTGPNTGGKTVSLKTIGLFTLMGPVSYTHLLPHSVLKDVPVQKQTHFLTHFLLSHCEHLPHHLKI